MEKSMHLSEVAKLVGVQPYRIVYAHVSGAIQEPSRFCGKRAYGEEDVRRVAEYFGVELSMEGTSSSSSSA